MGGNEHVANIPGSQWKTSQVVGVLLCLGSGKRKRHFPTIFPTAGLGKGAPAILVFVPVPHGAPARTQHLLTARRRIPSAPRKCPSSVLAQLLSALKGSLPRPGVLGAGSEWQLHFSVVPFQLRART